MRRGSRLGNCPFTGKKARLELDRTNGTMINFAIKGVHVVQGSEFDDLLFGTNLADTLMGLDKDDTITGRDGNDILFGGEDDDNVTGGNGADTYQPDSSSKPPAP